MVPAAPSPAPVAPAAAAPGARGARAGAPLRWRSRCPTPRMATGGLPPRARCRAEPPAESPRAAPLAAPQPADPGSARSSSVRSPRPRPAPQREPRQRSARPQGPAATPERSPQGRSARARRTRKPVTDTGLRSASFVFRHRAGNAVIFLVLIVAAAQLFNLQVPRAAGPARRGGRPAQGHRRREGGARQHRRPQQRQARVHHRSPGADVPAGQDPQAAGRGQAEVARRARPRQRLRDIATEVAARLNNKPDAKTVLKKLQEQRDVRLPGPRRRSRDRRRDHQEVPRGRRGTPGSAPVSGRLAGGQHRRRHRLGRPRAARPRGLAGLDAGRHRRLGHLRPRLRRRGDPGQLPQPARRGQRLHRPADPRRRHPVLRPAAGAAGQGRLRRQERLGGGAGRENR